jgi:phosphonate transport system substrate-binding protein
MLQKRNRRVLLSTASAALLSGLIHPALASRGEPTLRFGTTPVFLDEQVRLLARWQLHLEQQLGQSVNFVQRGSYREIIELLLNDGIDVAWLCGYPLVLNESKLRVVSIPHYNGAPLYRSYLVVPNDDVTTKSILDLRGRTFAFSDPLSNSGYLVPRAELAAGGAASSTFFRRTFFTFSHRKIVDAVRVRLANAGAMDGYVWDTLAAQNPAAIAGLRVAWRSPEHAFPPIVARKNWAQANANAFYQVLHSMAQHDSGKAILKDLNLDGFLPPTAGQFESIRQLVRTTERWGG